MKKLILISGKMRSGKNTFADMIGDILAPIMDVKYDLFAKDLKFGVRDDFAKLHQFIKSEYQKIPLELKEYFSWMDVKEENFFEDKTEYSRLLLQIYGTEIFRNRVDDNWWVKQVENRWLKFSSESGDGVYIITDVRFPNEIKYFHRYDKVSVRVERENKEGTYNEEHISEKALDDYCDFDYRIGNDGSLDDLRKEAEKFCSSLILGVN